MTDLSAIARSCLTIFALNFLCGCHPAADLIPEAPAADEIEAFDRDNMQLFFTLSTAQAISLLKNNPDTVIVDIRNAEAFAEGHLPGAAHYDVKSEGFRQEIDGLDRQAKILIYGSAATTRDIRTTDSAVTRLKTLDFQTVYRMTGGIEAWIEAEQPFVRDIP